jgi:hypothetical protein
MSQRRALIGIVVPAAVGVSLLAWLLRTRALPLGWPGEWTWERLGVNVAPNPLGWVVGALVIAAYALIVTALARWVGAGESRSAGRALALLAVLALVVQAVLQECAPDGYGLSKWPIALHSAGANGYFTLARGPLMADTHAFLKAYPAWIKQQDALHIGTHPPGLLLAWRGVIDLARAHPALAQAIVDCAPPSVSAGFALIARHSPLTTADKAAIVTVGAATLALCALAIVPIYALSRQARLGRSEALAAAALWPLVPAAILFQPTADTAYPTLAASALALAASRRRGAPILAGACLALALQLSLAFLAVGLLIAIAILTDPARTLRDRGATLVAIALGFLLVTAAIWAFSQANPLVIWWHNAANHRRFYDQFPRSFWVWNLLNPIEFAVALGVPVVAAAIAALPNHSGARLAWITCAILLILQLSGRNLSEVARLWLPFMPMFLPAAAAGLHRLGGRAAVLAATISLLGAQSLISQALIQVVYPAT